MLMKWCCSQNTLTQCCPSSTRKRMQDVFICVHGAWCTPLLSCSHHYHDRCVLSIRRTSVYDNLILQSNITILTDFWIWKSHPHNNQRLRSKKTRIAERIPRYNHNNLIVLLQYITDISDWLRFRQIKTHTMVANIIMVSDGNGDRERKKIITHLGLFCVSSIESRHTQEHEQIGYGILSPIPISNCSGVTCSMRNGRIRVSLAPIHLIFLDHWNSLLITRMFHHRSIRRTHLHKIHS